MADKRYKVGLEILTPIHIGTGKENDWVKGADFAQKGGRVYVIDIKTAVEKGINVPSLFIPSNQNERNKIEDIDCERLKSISRYVFNSPQSTNNDIKSCLRNRFLDTPVIAGSSIKGAVRSALFRHLGAEYLNKQRGKQSKDSQLIKHIFGDMKVGSDFMRFIRITDIEIPRENNDSQTPGTILVNTKLFNLQNNNPAKHWKGGWKNGENLTEEKIHSDKFNTLYECIEPGKKGEGSIIFGRSGFKLFVDNQDKIFKKEEGHIYYTEEKKKLMDSEINELFKVINKATKRYLEEEEAFFKKYDEADHTNSIIESIQGLKSLIPDEDSDTGTYCVLKMSAGVGFHAITGNWQYDSFVETGTVNGKINKKSRRIAIYSGDGRKPYLTGYELMGFVMLRVISDKDIEYDKLLESANVLMKEGKWQDAYRKVNKAKSLCPSRNDHEDILKQCEERKKMQEYKNLIDEARKLLASKKWAEAKAKAEEAEKIAVSQYDHREIVKECERAIKFSKPLSDILNNGMTVGNIIGTTEKWINYHSFGEKEYIVVKDCLKGTKEKELKKNVGRLRNVIDKNNTSWTERLLKELYPKEQTPTNKEPQTPAKTEVEQKPKEVSEIVNEQYQESMTVQIQQPIEPSSEKVLPEVVEMKGQGIMDKIMKWFKGIF